MADKINKKIESLVEAIGILKGFQNPDSYCYQIKNPLLVKSFARPGKHIIDEDGRRIFDSWLAGYKACAYDIGLKVSGESRAGLKDTDKLSNLLKVYGLEVGLAHDQVVKYLRRSLKDPAITKDTPLTYFNEV